MTNIPFDDKEKLNDALSSQKLITGDYNTFANEAATPEVKVKVMELLCDEHELEHELWSEMNVRGWYPVEKADDNKLNNVKSKFSTQA